jgi:hypothetical protein
VEKAIGKRGRKPIGQLKELVVEVLPARGKMWILNGNSVIELNSMNGQGE